MTDAPRAERRSRRGGRRRRPAALRAGVIGAGPAGLAQARAYAALPAHAELHGIHDCDRDAMSQAAEQHRTRGYAELDALLEDVDVVSIASPASLHLKHALRALDAGVHVLIEPPLAPSVDDAAVIVAAAAHHPELVVQAGGSEYFDPAIGEVREMLATQSPIAVDVQRLEPFEDGAAMRQSDVIDELMLTDIQTILSIARAPVAHVQSAARPVHSIDSADLAVAHLIFDDGMIASLTASRVTESEVRRLTATTTEAHLTLDCGRRTIEFCLRSRAALDAAGDRRPRRRESIIERIDVLGEDPVVAQLSAFLAAVRGEQPVAVPAADGLRCLELAERIREAAGAVRSGAHAETVLGLYATADAA